MDELLLKPAQSALVGAVLSLWRWMFGMKEEYVMKGDRGRVAHPSSLNRWVKLNFQWPGYWLGEG